MKSHEYDLRPIDLAHWAGSLLGPVILFTALLRFAALSGGLPAPWPALDTDRTVLTHQAKASSTSNQADVLFLGDSSCLMDVSASGLEALCVRKHHALNLGSSMYVGLNGYAAMLSRNDRTNPRCVRTVVVLLHPEMLQGVRAVSPYLVFLSDIYAGVDHQDSASLHGQLCGLLGLHIVQGRLWSRMPLALPGEYGRFYGFNLDLDDFMTRHQGSAIDPHQFQAEARQGMLECRLAPSLEPGCLALRAAVPERAKLIAGLTPVPESAAPADYATRWQQLLTTWGRWMHADVLLTNLPPTMPDSLCASTTHLNQEGCRRFTRILAQHLEPFLD